MPVIQVRKEFKQCVGYIDTLQLVMFILSWNVQYVESGRKLTSIRDTLLFSQKVNINNSNLKFIKFAYSHLKFCSYFCKNKILNENNTFALLYTRLRN